jgi:hypothetical protein
LSVVKKKRKRLSLQAVWENIASHKDIFTVAILAHVFVIFKGGDVHLPLSKKRKKNAFMISLA